MTDRELLELAAKAAGLEHEGFTESTDDSRGPGIALWSPRDGYSYWNPLEDDGDALRLAVKMKMDIRIYGADVRVACCGVIAMEGAPCLHSATRRAIVRAAADIGRNMP